MPWTALLENASTCGGRISGPGSGASFPAPRRSGYTGEGQEPDILALIRAELQRENRRVFVRDIVLNTFFFLLGVGVTLASHYLWS